jgi:hypothetical protein
LNVLCLITVLFISKAYQKRLIDLSWIGIMAQWATSIGGLPFIPTEGAKQRG